jgi:F420-non-reducing hydrogenase iron-sulfur subunit
MVLVGACHLPYDCHYIDGNQKMKTRMEILANMLQKLGLSPDRFRIEYISAAEGVKFAEVVREMAAKLNEIGKDKVKAENEKLKPNLDRMLERKSK